MRRKVANNVKKMFSQRIQRDITFHETTSQDIPLGCRLYEYRVADDLVFYLELVISPTSDWFTIEVIWTRTDRIPGSLVGGPIPIPGHNDSGERFRIGDLWWEGIEDYWWKLGRDWFDDSIEPEDVLDGKIGEVSEQQALTKGEQCIDDAIAHIKRYAFPYFKDVASKFGYDFMS